MFFLNFFSLYRIFFIKIINEVVYVVNFKIGDFAVRFCACQTSCYFGLWLAILCSLLKFHSRHCFPENFSKMMILIVFVGSCTFINGLKILVVFLVNALIVSLAIFHFVDRIEVFVANLVFTNVISYFLNIIHIFVISVFQILV